jgi:hypothetical protein
MIENRILLIFAVFYIFIASCKKDDESQYADRQDIGYIDALVGEMNWYDFVPKEAYSTQVCITKFEVDSCTQDSIVGLEIQAIRNTKYPDIRLIYILLPIKLDDKLSQSITFEKIYSRVFRDAYLNEYLIYSGLNEKLFKGDKCNNFPKVSYGVNFYDARFIEYFHDPFKPQLIKIDKYDGKVLEGSFDLNFVNARSIDRFPPELKITCNKFKAEFKK